MAELLTVRGDCPKCGKPVERKAPKGRVTWRGQCPKRGCTGTVIARRVRTDAPPADPPAAEEPAKRTPRKVVKASGYRRQRPDGDVRPAPVQRTEREPAPVDERREPVKSDEPEQPGGEREPERPVKADQHETGHTGRRHPYGHLFPAVWG